MRIVQFFFVCRQVPLHLTVAGAMVFLVVLSCCGVTQAAVFGCPAGPITLAMAENLVIGFSEDPNTSQSCGFIITDFTLNVAQTFQVFEPNGTTESDRIVAFNTFGQATLCIASDPDLSDCVKQGAVVNLGNEDAVKGLIATRTLAGTTNGQNTGLKFILFSDGTNPENIGQCSDTFVGAKAGASPQSSCALPTPEPETPSLLGLGTATLGVFWRRRKR